MSTRPMTEERLAQIRMSYAGFPEDAIPLLEEKAELIDEVDFLQGIVSQQSQTLREKCAEIDRLRELNSRLTRSLGTLEQGIADAPDTDWREHLRSAIERARSFGPPETTQKAAAQPAEPAASAQPVLWLFRAGSGPVYASRQKPEPLVLADVLAWTIDGQHCPVPLPLRDWIEPGQRMALVALPIGGDA